MNGPVRNFGKPLVMRHRYIDIETGNYETKIINKNQK